MSLYRLRGYSTTQKTLGREQNIETLHFLLDHHGKGEPSDWTALLQARARLGRVQEVKDLWKTMKDKGIIPGRWAWQAYAYAHAQQGDVQGVEVAIDNASHAGYPLAEYGLLLQVMAYGKAQKGEEALIFVQKLDSQGQLSPSLADALVLALGESKMLDAMLQLLDHPTSFLPSLQDRPWPRARSFRLAFHTQAYTPPQLSLDVYELMNAKQIPLDAACYEHLIIRLCRSSDHFDLALDLFIQMRQKLRSPGSAYLYSQLIKRCYQFERHSFGKLLEKERRKFSDRLVKSHRLF